MKTPSDVEKNTEDKVLQFLTQREARDLLRNIKDPLKSESFIRTQAEKGNYLFLDSAMNAPEGSQTFISDKTMEAILSNKLYKTSPENMKKLDQLHYMKRTILGMTKALKNSLRQKDVLTDQNQSVTFLNQAG